jgi:hypothetical protein
MSLSPFPSPLLFHPNTFRTNRWIFMKLHIKHCPIKGHSVVGVSFPTFDNMNMATMRKCGLQYGRSVYNSGILCDIDIRSSKIAQFSSGQLFIEECKA